MFVLCFTYSIHALTVCTNWNDNLWDLRVVVRVLVKSLSFSRNVFHCFLITFLTVFSFDLVDVCVMWCRFQIAKHKLGMCSIIDDWGEVVSFRKISKLLIDLVTVLEYRTP